MSIEKLSRIDSIDETDKIRKESHDTTQNDSRRTSILNQSRRQSRYSFTIRKSIFGRHGSFIGLSRGGMNKNIKYENTYRITPKPNEKIKQKQLQNLIQTTLDNTLKDVTYEPKQAYVLSMNLANMLRKSVRELNTPSRYKFIVQVHIGSPQNSSIFISSQAVWNIEMGDTYASAIFSNSKVFAVGIIHAVYFE
ncbi:Tctex1 domain-containing protein [Schistosoma japonicum]|uniref:Tctex1 domain containing-protein 1 n=1 Tax=Schistosoma japonicum TaxID=6182 RepID=B3GUT4_SCHJA|nr:Tctex1 domain-containing protein [Schistosoma japonicum]CAX73566.1 Tctex1 domain containing-protein 1 [Schistosoma japonicum]